MYSCENWRNTIVHTNTSVFVFPAKKMANVIVELFRKYLPGRWYCLHRIIMYYMFKLGLLQSRRRSYDCLLTGLRSCQCHCGTIQKRWRKSKFCTWNINGVRKFKILQGKEKLAKFENQHIPDSNCMRRKRPYLLCWWSVCNDPRNARFSIRADQREKTQWWRQRRLFHFTCNSKLCRAQ